MNNPLTPFLGIAFAATFAPLYATTVSRFRKLEETVTKLAKRATKLGLEAPRLEVVHEFAKPRLRRVNVDKSLLGWDDPRIVRRLGEGAVLITTSEMVPMVRFRLIGQAPRLNGWTFRSTLEHMGDETIIAAVPGFSVPAKYRATGNRCEHCQVNRARVQTFVLEHDDGRMVQVGRSCLRDFLGHQDPHKAASYAEELGTLVELCGASGGEEDELSDGYSGGYSGGRSPQAWNLADYLGYVAANIRANGWVSRAQARDTLRSSTADNAHLAMFPPLSVKREDVITPEAQDVATATAALAWVRDGWLAAREEGAELADYEHNVATIVKMGYVTDKTMGIAASIVSAHARAIGREVEKKRALAGKHVGTEGKREIFKGLAVARIHDIEGTYGVSRLHVFYDDAGNTLVWKASNEKLDIGATYDVTATVKRHAMNNKTGAPETWLSRAKAVRVEA